MSYSHNTNKILVIHFTNCKHCKYSNRYYKEPKKVLSQTNWVNLFFRRIALVFFYMANQLWEQQTKNHKNEVTMLMFHSLFSMREELLSMNQQDLDNLQKEIETKLKEVCKRLEAINNAVTPPELEFSLPLAP